MSEPTLRPCWTPDDARQTAIDAAAHTPYLGVADDPDDTQPDVMASPRAPFVRDMGRSCGCCGAGPLERCDPGCLSLMTPEQQQRHREMVAAGVLAYLAKLDAAGHPYQPYQAPEPVGMRPRRARLIGRVLVAVAVAILFLTTAVLFITAVPR